jgi:lycopene cyclase domain-containing protein
VPPGRATYLALLAGCLLLTLPLELLLGVRVYRRPRRWLATVAPVLLVFGLWDALAIRAGHWRYNPRFTTGWVVPGGLPVEELAFFVVVPTCALLTYEAVGRLLGRRRPR